MSEEDLFAAALETPTPEERAKFLAAACGGDTALRQRVEALLDSHEHGGAFLKTPAIQLEVGASSGAEGDTEASPRTGEHHDDDLSFLQASQQQGSIGKLGHYEVQEVIGRGGMGIVLRALDEKLHRVAAIKVMAAHLATNATARQRFTREAQAAAAVTHDHIVTIYAVEDAADLPYLAMQYVAGVSLQERIDRSGPLKLEEILRIGMQTASGLAAAHAQGLIHRDIKPANILLENGVERVKITDFGLARAADDANVTQSGMVAGTPHFMSPEQALGVALDQRSDLFSLGSVLYAMCTGRAPFRASGTVAILKRVCDETPTPVSQINSAIPIWLAAIIEKLHAKDPAERYQSAAEVAEVLGRHLAHVQHPSVMPLPQAVSAPVAEPVQRVGLPNRSRAAVGPWWTVAAVLLFLLVGGLSLSEAVGLTRLVPTVIRILTPEGTLVVETDEPGVKVTVEGDGGLTIVAGGLEEIRLKPGSYKLQADKNGKPLRLDQELVTITRGGDRRVVRVRLEGETKQAPVIAATGEGPFVLLAAGNERQFGTLGEAISSASEGDTIEVRGNGPFVIDPITTKQALTIRAGAGRRPVLRQSEASVYDRQLFEVKGPLVLEGLVLESVSQRADTGKWNSLVSQSKSGGSLRAANCRFLKLTMGTCIFVDGSGSHVLRNCEFVTPPKNWAVQYWTPSSNSTYVVENCCLTATISIAHRQGDLRAATLCLRRNTVLGNTCVYVPILTLRESAEADESLPSIRVEAEQNVFNPTFDTPVFRADFQGESPLQAADVTALLPTLANWRGERNLFATERQMFEASVKFDREHAERIADLAAWNRFWGPTDSESLQGRIRFQGDTSLNGSSGSSEKIGPEDFRLRADSAGYRAGPDGEDLGADVDLVGPGAAYERWKKTPEYQEWLKESGQQE